MVMGASGFHEVELIIRLFTKSALCGSVEFIGETKAWHYKNMYTVGHCTLRTKQ